MAEGVRAVKVQSVEWGFQALRSSLIVYASFEQFNPANAMRSSYGGGTSFLATVTSVFTNLKLISLLPYHIYYLQAQSLLFIGLEGSEYHWGLIAEHESRESY